VSGLEIGSQAKTKRELELEANDIDILSQLNQSQGVISGLNQEIKRMANQINELNQALKMLECDNNQNKIELNLFRGRCAQAAQVPSEATAAALIEAEARAGDPAEAGEEAKANVSLRDLTVDQVIKLMASLELQGYLDIVKAKRLNGLKLIVILNHGVRAYFNGGDDVDAAALESELAGFNKDGVPRRILE
jgi:TolA-binding protein